MHPYEDIIHLGPKHSKARMSMAERAARFSPFAALLEHDESVKEKERDILGLEEEHEWDEEYRNLLFQLGELEKESFI